MVQNFVCVCVSDDMLIGVTTSWILVRAWRFCVRLQQTYTHTHNPLRMVFGSPLSKARSMHYMYERAIWIVVLYSNPISHDII